MLSFRKQCDSGSKLLTDAQADNNWALTGESLSSEVCEQQRRIPVCADAQTDQPLCYSLNAKYHIKTCYKQKFTILAIVCVAELAGFCMA